MTSQHCVCWDYRWQAFAATGADAGVGGRAATLRIRVVPSELNTPAYQEWLTKFDDPAGKLATIVKNIPLEKRMTTPAEIAATVVFLLSPVSGHTTGQHVFVDGGYVHLDRASTAG